MSLEVICGCMPHLAGFFKHRDGNVPFLFPTKSLASRLSSGITRRYKSSELNSTSDRVDSRSASDPYLENYILGSVQGSGKSIQCVVKPQKIWLGQATKMQQIQGPSTLRAEFND